MKNLELESPSVLEKKFTQQSQHHYSAKTIPQNPTHSKEAAAELWQAIKTIIGLQNQAPPLQPISRNRDLPLSFSQERLWLLNQLNPESSAHNIPIALYITGTINVPALEQSLNEILQRHETLRTTFTEVNGQPVQRISPAATFSLPVVDLREIPPLEQEIQTVQLTTQEAQRPFNLNQGSLLRAKLLQLSENEHVLLLSIHQIVFDGWSEGVLFRELAALYAAFSDGKPSPLVELPIQYADFAHWQRQALQGGFLEALLSYWKDQLKDGLPARQLIPDHPRPAVPTRQSAHETLVLSQELTRQLKALSQQEGATLFATLLAAFKVLLHRYTEQDNLFVCTPTANRNRSQTKSLIGYFVNLLILRTNLSGNPSFRELLGRVRQVASGAYAHQDLPIQQLLHSLNLVNTPLSQVMFSLQNIPRQLPEFPGLRVSALNIDNGTADFDLSLSMVEEGAQLSGVLKYNTDLFEQTTITQMLRDFQTLLEAIVANPEQPLTSLQSHLIGRCTPLVREQTSAELATPANYVAPKDTLELQLTQIWEKVLGIHPIGVKDNFFDLGGHSLLAANLFAQIQETFSKNLPLASLLQAPTIQQLANTLRQQEETTPWSLLVPIRASGSKPPLFCVHGGGGDILFLRDLVHHLGSDQPVYGLRSQGLDAKQALHTQIEEIATRYIKEIQTFQPEGPYFLGGYSMGGRIAYEMAQQFHAQGQKVLLLALLDTWGPGYPKLLPIQQRSKRYWRTFLQLNPKQKLAYILEKGGNVQKRVTEAVTGKVWRTVYKFYSAIGHPLPKAYRNVREANDLAMKNYVPQPYPGQVTLFRGKQPTAWKSEPQMGWNGLAVGGIEVHEVPGYHLEVFKEPHVRVLAEKLRSCLEKAQAEDSAQPS